MSSRPAPPIPRPSLSTLSAEIGQLPLTTLVAPAGSGKSTLMSHWRQTLPDDVEPVWLEIVPPHADLAVFTLDLLDALRRRPGLPRRFGEETQRVIANLASGADDWRVAHRAFLRDWLSMTGEVVLFLDNFHAVAPESDTDAFVSELLRGLPANLHVVIATRGTLPAAVTRLRAGGAVLEVGVDDLNLRAEEVAAILSARGVAPQDELVATLLGQTEGWVTGILLAARALSRIPEGERRAYAARLAKERDLFAYVAAEVLSGESEEVVAVLERAALLGRCEIDDLARILDDPDPHHQIGQALDHGLLLGEGSEVWIQQLWQELMRSRLRERLAPEAWRALHGRVAALLAERGRVEEALEAYRESEDWDAIAYLLHGVGHEWLERGRASGVRRWLEALPTEVRESEPRLLEMQGMLLMSNEPEEATQRLEEAVRSYRQRGDDEGVRGVLGILAYHHLSRLDLRRTQKALRRSFRPQRLLRDSTARADLYVALAGVSLMRRRFHRSIKLSERARRAPVGPAIRWLNLCNLGLLYSLSGDLEKARRMLDESLADPSIARRAFAYYPLMLVRGYVLSRLGDLSAAQRDVESAREGIEEFRLLRFRPPAALIGADVSGLLGDREASERDFAETVEFARKSGALTLEALARGQMALRWYRWEEPEQALAEARRAVEVHERGIVDGSITFPWWLPISLWIVGRLGDPKQAWQRLLPHRRAVLPDGLPMTRTTAMLAMADLADRAGARSEARQLARDAWQLAERTGAGFERTAGPVVLPYAAGEALRQDVGADVAFDALRMHRPDAVPELLERLARDRSPEVRVRAIERMRQFGGRALHPALVRAGKDRNARVRSAAERALPELDLRPDYALRIDALGGFRAFRGEEPIPDADWRGTMSLRLMYRLLAAEGRPVSREVLQADLWPDAEETAGRNNLRVALSRLSDALDPDRLAGTSAWFVSSGPTGLALDPSRLGRLDVVHFREAVRAAENARGAGRMDEALAAYRRAVEAYAGPFLPEAAYEEWALPLRRRLEDEFRSVGERYGALLLEGARHDEAIRLADRLLDQDPADEGAWALRMKSQLVRGDRSGAFRTYEQARASLRATLEVEPGPALLDLAARARGDAARRG